MEYLKSKVLSILIVTGCKKDSYIKMELVYGKTYLAMELNLKIAPKDSVKKHWLITIQHIC